MCIRVFVRLCGVWVFGTLGGMALLGDDSMVDIYDGGVWDLE